MSGGNIDISGTLKVRGELQVTADPAGAVLAGPSGRTQAVTVNQVSGKIRMAFPCVITAGYPSANVNDWCPSSSKATCTMTNSFVKHTGSTRSSIILCSIDCGGNNSQQLSISGGGYDTANPDKYQFIIANLGNNDYTAAVGQNGLEISFLVINPAV